MILALLPLQAFGEVTVTAENPRGYGWWLGDRLSQRITVRHAAGTSIDRASLPRARSVDYWLDLVAVETNTQAEATEIVLQWQNFYVALEPSRREVPGATIRLSDGSEARLPGFVFVTSPIRPILAPSTRDQLQPNPPFLRVDPGANRSGLAATALLFAVLLAVLDWHQAWWPFHARPARPLTQAARRIAAERRSGAARLRQILHRGLDTAFGQVLIGADLDRFLEARPEFRPVHKALDAFFQNSDAAFFGQAAATDRSEEIAVLARQLSNIERGRR